MHDSISTAQTALATLGNLPSGYAHDRKHCQPRPLLPLRGGWLKWYEIALPAAPVPAAIGRLAREFLQREAAEGKLLLGGDLGFSVLHRCGEDFYFLLPCTWRNQNELWETVYTKDGVASPDFRLLAEGVPHRPTFCVWELGAVFREQQAWERYLLSAHDEIAKQAYLGETYEGPV